MCDSGHHVNKNGPQNVVIDQSELNIPKEWSGCECFSQYRCLIGMVRWEWIFYSLSFHDSKWVKINVITKQNLCTSFCDFSLPAHSKTQVVLFPFIVHYAFFVTKCCSSLYYWEKNRSSMSEQSMVFKHDGKVFSVALVLIIKALPLWILPAKLCGIQPSPAHKDTDCNEA